jgi:hypothetical protein
MGQGIRQESSIFLTWELKGMNPCPYSVPLLSSKSHKRLYLTFKNYIINHYARFFLGIIIYINYE